MTQPDRASRIETAIRRAFATTHVSVADRSAQHAGHAGASAAGETHYDLTVVSDAFEGLSRVARSRVVHDLLSVELATGLHALSLTLRTPAEAAASVR